MSAAPKLQPDQDPVAIVAPVLIARDLRAQSRMTVFTFIAVLVLGMVISFDMLQPPQGLESPDGAATKLRNPASMTNETKDVAAADQAVDVRTDCNPTAEIVIPAFVNQVRLIGSACTPRTAFESSQINNVTNGYAATVFYPTPAEYTTDYISLSRDENLIHITHFMKKSGREVRELKIRRE